MQLSQRFKHTTNIGQQQRIVNGFSTIVRMCICYGRDICNSWFVLAADRMLCVELNSWKNKGNPMGCCIQRVSWMEVSSSVCLCWGDPWNHHTSCSCACVCEWVLLYIYIWNACECSVYSIIQSSWMMFVHTRTQTHIRTRPRNTHRMHIRTHTQAYTRREH